MIQMLEPVAALHGDKRGVCPSPCFFYLPLFENFWKLNFKPSPALVRTKDASFYIFGFMHWFKLSEECRIELLQLCHYLLPIENYLPKTLNKLKEKIGLEKLSFNEIKYCESCRILCRIRVIYFMIFSLILEKLFFSVDL